MFDEYNARPVLNKEIIRYHCNGCGACCRNVRDSVMLEALDAFRLLKHLSQQYPERTKEELLAEFAEPCMLSRGYFIYVLKTVNDSGTCIFLQDNRCSIYPARPRTCRLYPFALEPREKRMQWYLCLEQPHHFTGGHITARGWERKHLSKEDKDFLRKEMEVLPKLGELMKQIPNKLLPRAEALALSYTYHSYNLQKLFLPQYEQNMTELALLLEKMAVEKKITKK